MVNLEMVRGGMGTMHAQSIPLAGGDAGVHQTIRAMRRLIEQGKKDPIIHESAANILRGANVPAFNWAGEVRAIYNWVAQNIRFTRDVYGKETLHAAAEILRLGIGDCDDFTILLCSLLGTVGHKTRILTISKPEDERHFSHVFPQVFLDGQWITIDAARRNPMMGRSPENTERVRIWDTASDNFVDVQGLAGPGGANPNALPNAYPAWVADPRFRTLRGSTGIQGLGHYGAGEARAALAGMRNTGSNAVPYHHANGRLYRRDAPLDPITPGMEMPRAVLPPAEASTGTDMRLPVRSRNDVSRERMMKRLHFRAPDGTEVDYSTRGLGHWKRNNRGSRGLGDFSQCDPGDTACEIAMIASAAATGTANIISATRAAPYNLFPTTSQVMSQRTVAPLVTSPVGTIGGISTGTLLLGGLGIAALAIFAGRR